MSKFISTETGYEVLAASSYYLFSGNLQGEAQNDSGALISGSVGLEQSSYNIDMSHFEKKGCILSGF